MVPLSPSRHLPATSILPGFQDNEAPAAPSRRRLRVALFSGNYDCVRDGANQALNRLVAFLLDRAGAEVRIYSPTAPTPAFKSVGKVVPVRSIGIPGRPEYRVALGLPRAIRRDLAAFAPDIVHLSAPDLLGRQAQKHARALGIPVVASLHTRFETYLDYYGLRFLRGPVERYLDRFYRDCDRVLAPTEPIAAMLREMCGGEKVAIWGRGVDRSRFHPGLRDEGFRTRLGYEAGDVVPLFFGRLVREKGLDIFAESIAAVRARGHAVRPMIVGNGPGRAWLAERLPNANFLGHLEGAALGRAVASADILVNPSVTEAFGNVNLEAMASGLAVISADVPSASALIAHGRTGLLVPQGDAGAFADAMTDLVRRPLLREVLGHAAANAADGYHWDDILASVVHVYEQCVPHPRGAGRTAAMMRGGRSARLEVATADG